MLLLPKVLPALKVVPAVIIEADEKKAKRPG
jgi:hypothetical protein